MPGLFFKIFAVAFFLGNFGAIFGHPTNFDEVFQRKTNFSLPQSNFDGIVDKIECFVCKMVAYEMLQVYSATGTTKCLTAILAEFCSFLQLEKTAVCSSLVQTFTDEVLYVLGQLLLKPEQLCGFLMPNTCGGAYDPMHSPWNVSFPNVPKPPVSKPTLPPADTPRLRVLQITDIHFDKLYEVGSNVNCQDPLCCRRYENDDGKGFKPAGFWGSPDGKCDLPLRTLINLLEHLKENETFDYVMWTGDLPAHNIWNQTKEDQLDAYSMLIKLFLKFFPDKPIYSVIGNHESCPVDSFPPHYSNLPANFSIDWLYTPLAKHWIEWIEESQSANIKKIASYVTKPSEGLRIISLNTMYCNGLNFWVYLNQTDPDGVLAWLVDQLQQAENAGDKVHVIGHVPPSECLSQWSLNYYRIVNRYEDTIRGQFFGHTHNDHFGVFYDKLDHCQRPTSVYFVAPSLTTYPRRFPTYRIYTVDGGRPNSTWRVLNHETFYLNLTEANQNNATTWRKEYDAKTAYNLTTLFPDEWSKLILAMNKNRTLFKRYDTYYNTKKMDCDEKCKSSRLCELRNLVRNYPGLCNDLIGGNFEQPEYSKFSEIFAKLKLSQDDQFILQRRRGFLPQLNKLVFSQKRFPFFPIPKECKPGALKNDFLRSNFLTHKKVVYTKQRLYGFEEIRLFVIVERRFSDILFVGIFLLTFCTVILLYLYKR